MQVISDSIPLIQKKIVDMIGDVFDQNQGDPILLFYSGGSSLHLLPLLYERIKELDLSAVIFAPVDERKSFENSNARAFSEMSVYRRFKERGVTFVDCGDLDRDLETVARDYNEQIELMIEDIREHDGMIISLLGMGEDGHTAGIFPYPESTEYFLTTFVETDALVVGYDVGDKNPYKERVTLTVPALKQADFNFVYVVGQSKESALKKVLVDGELAEVPARLWRSLHQSIVFTDCSIE